MGMAEIDTGLKQSILHSPAPRRGMLGQVSAIVCHSTLRRLSAIRELPVLVLTGTGDAMVRPENSERIAAALDAELLTFEGSGHAIHVEQRVAVNAALQRHFSQSARKVG